MIDKKILLLIVMSAVITFCIVVVNFYFFREDEILFPTINILSGLIFSFPIIMWRYADYRKYKELEEMFPVFLRDFVESIRSGLTIPQSLKSLTRNDYKSLNHYVKKMDAQTDWGIPVDKVLLNFSKEARSKMIGRIVSSVIESNRFGGNLADTFEALSNTSFEVERLKQERKLYLNSQMITGYIIFFVFVAVMIGLGKFLVPMLGGGTTPSLTGGGAVECSSFSIQATCEAQRDAKGDLRCYWDKKEEKCQSFVIREYKNLFMALILIQGLFAGLTVGKMAEGAVISGIKHSLIMVALGGLIFTLLG